MLVNIKMESKIDMQRLNYMQRLDNSAASLLELCRRILCFNSGFSDADVTLICLFMLAAAKQLLSHAFDCVFWLLLLFQLTVGIPPAQSGECSSTRSLLGFYAPPAKGLRSGRPSKPPSPIMVLKTELCRFSGAKIYPGKGIRFVRADSQVFLFSNSKCKRYFHNRLKPSKLCWTAVYRKQHKKDIAAEAVKKRTSYNQEALLKIYSWCHLGSYSEEKK
ncbi:hypothetical protein Ancab_032603 [Ancistrocladus abbreviatus]